jgi:glyoxylase-like metal-dependent hydrolase (beta-lactamase superfamily II)
MNRWKIGDVTISQLVELTVNHHGPLVLPEARPEHVLPITWLKPHFIDDAGNLIFNIQAMVIESQGHRIIVDTCVGNDKNIPVITEWSNRHGFFLEDLEGLGFAPESIDTVAFTHLHVDHVGWNTRRKNGQWVPTFSQARHLLVRDEWDFWSTANDDPLGPTIMSESVRPVFAAGLVDLVGNNHKITDEVWLESTPGHTPGHVSIRISSRGKDAVITGDLMHHPCQFQRIEWASSFDADQAGAIATRRAFLERYAEQPVLVIGTHFALPTAGKIRREGEVYRFEV